MGYKVHCICGKCGTEVTVLETERVTAVCTADAHVRLNTAWGVAETKVGTESAKHAEG